MCQNYKSALPTCVEAEGKPNKKSKKGGAKGSVAILKESAQFGCVSQDSYPSKSILREPGKLGTKRTVKFSKGTWHQIKIRERKVHREVLSQSVRLMSVVLGDLSKNMYKLKNSDRPTFNVPIEDWENKK